MNFEEPRTRGDLIQMFKIVNGHEKINLVNGVNFAKSLKMNLRREHNMKLVREISKRGLFRYNFLSNRIVSRWNDLPQSVVNAETVNSFKSGIDKKVFGMVQRKRRKTADKLWQASLQKRSTRRSPLKGRLQV